MAREAARYLAEERWKKPYDAHATDTSTFREHEEHHFEENVGHIEDTDFPLEEFKAVIQKAKNNKQAGPDRCRAELFRWLDGHNQIAHLRIHKNLFTDDMLHPCLNKANIVQFVKKGDATKMENYRPIALLPTIYKLIAAMMKNRLVAALETWINKTQYGFKTQYGLAKLNME